MSEIPFVNLLGDELERAAKRTGRRARSRRLGLFALAGALLVSGTALATGLLSGDVEQQATNAIACYDGADPDFSGSVAVMPQEAGSPRVSPVARCRQVLGLSGRDVPPLVACANEASVAVIPGRNPSACTDAGFAPLDPAYRRARVRAARLERRILAIEASADCIAPAELARRVQHLLDRSGWTGWTVALRAGDGHCGSVSAIGGDGRRYIGGDIDSHGKRVFVSRVAPRRIMDLLYSADRTLLGPLFAESGARCFTFESFRARVEAVFGAKGLDATVTHTTIPRNTGLDDEDGRWTRYKQGCAVLAGGAPGDDDHSVEIQAFVKP
jgi:hypothetical protein